MKIKRYVPNYVETQGDEIAEVFSRHRLLSVPFVRNWAKDSADWTFLGFALDNQWLIAFFKSKKDSQIEWYVVAKVLSELETAKGWFPKAYFCHDTVLGIVGEARRVNPNNEWADRLEAAYRRDIDILTSAVKALLNGLQAVYDKECCDYGTGDAYDMAEEVVKSFGEEGAGK